MTSKLLSQAVGLSGTTGNSTNITVSSNGSLQLAANGGTDIYISANDNIGFGNTTPVDKLSIQGSLYTSSNTVTIGTAAYHVANGNFGLGLNTPSEKLQIFGGNIKVDSASRWIGYWETDTIHDGYLVPYNGSGQTELVNSFGTGSIIFKTGQSKTESARIDSSGRLLIGLTGAYGSSGEKLTVNGMLTAISNTTSDGNSTLYLYNTNRTASNNQPYITFHDGDSVRARMGINYTDGALWILGAFGTYFRNNSGEIARFDSSGNFGVGTTGPANIIDLGTGTNGRGIVWGGTSGVGHYSSIWTGYSYGHLTFATGYKPDTTADNFLSSYNSASLYRNVIRLDAYDNKGIRFFTDTPANSAVGTALSPTERMRIDPNGRVRIGASGYTARNPLDVPDSMVTSYTYYEKSSTSNLSSYIGKGSSQNENLQFYLSNAADMIFYTSGSERMRIDSNGRITTPAQPMFNGYSVDNYNITSDYIRYSGTTINISSSYNTSTGLFTAPIAGNYYFVAHCFTDTSASSSCYWYLRMMKNGSQVGGIAHSGYGFSRAYETMSINVSVYMAAGDTMGVYFTGGNGSKIYGSGGYGNFSGFLIG